MGHWGFCANCGQVCPVLLPCDDRGQPEPPALRVEALADDNPAGGNCGVGLMLAFLVAVIGAVLLLCVLSICG